MAIGSMWGCCAIVAAIVYLPAARQSGRPRRALCADHLYIENTPPDVSPVQILIFLLLAEVFGKRDRRPSSELQPVPRLSVPPL